MLVTQSLADFVDSRANKVGASLFSANATKAQEQRKLIDETWQWISIIGDTTGLLISV